MGTKRLIYWFDEIRKEDSDIVGIAASKLGELTASGVPVAPGFVISTTAYFAFLNENSLISKVTELLTTVDFKNPDSISQVSSHIHTLFHKSMFSDELTHTIDTHYRRLSGTLSRAQITVHSSGGSESLQSLEQDFLTGEANLIERVRSSWADHFSPVALQHYHHHSIDPFRFTDALIVQRVLKIQASGLLFTHHPESKALLSIQAVYGFYDRKQSADLYELKKQDLTPQKKLLIKQETMRSLIKDSLKETAVPKDREKLQKITDDKILELGALGKKIERHFFFPQEVGWVLADNTIYITYIRHHAALDQNTNTRSPNRLLAKGKPLSPGMAAGPVNIIMSTRDAEKILPGDVVVAPISLRETLPQFKKAAAIILKDENVPSIHVPMIGQVKDISMITQGMVVSVNGNTGEIHHGAAFSASSQVQSMSPRTATKVYVTLTQPDLAENIAKEEIDGVGLLRAEAIQADIGIHPKQMIKDGRKSEYIDALVKQMNKVAAVFSPRPVIYRTSNFTASQYQKLAHGEDFETSEENPLLGFRGGFRAVHNPEVFELELEAVLRVRNKYGHKNIWLMLPFVRSVRELIHLKQTIAASGLHRTPSFQIWLSVALPVNVLLLEKFIGTGIDGVSIDIQMLTTLLLGTDHKNSLVSRAFDEQNEAVLWATEHTIKIAHKHHIAASVLGETLSLYPSLLEDLVWYGITSVSVPADAVQTTRQQIATIEQRLILEK